MRYAILTLVLGLMLGCGQADSRGQRMAPMVRQADESDRTVELDLYVKDYRTDTEREFCAAHPEIFSTPAVIAYFGRQGCAPCIPQKAELKAHVGEYNIVFYDADTPKAAEVLAYWKLDSATPQTVIAEQGKVRYVFRGYTPWKTIERAALSALKVPPKKTNIDIGPIHIDIDGDDVDVNIGRERKAKGPLADWFANRDGSKLQDWTETALAWTIAHWDTIVKVALILLMFA